MYGSRYGSTEEVSKKIADILKERGFSISILNFTEVSTKTNPTLEKYDGILLASGIKIGKWTKESKKFIESNIDFFKNSDKPLGIFVSAGSASNAEKVKELRKEYIENILDGYGIKADLYDVFGGVFDLTKDSKIGFLAKKMIKMASKEDPNIKLDQRNDLRDWNQIQKFAEDFAELVKK